MSVEALQVLIEFKKRKLETNKKKIKEIEILYNSLLKFKGSVNESKSSFVGANSKKSTDIRKVQSIKNCRTAKIYYSGMVKILSGTGSKIANFYFEVLLNSVSSKLKSYLEKIKKLESENLRLVKEIEQLDQKVEFEKTKEELLARKEG